MKRNESGFTLIELVLVGALLTVLVGLTVPGVRGGFQRFAEERASSEMEELSRYARTLAIIDGVCPIDCLFRRRTDPIASCEVNEEISSRRGEAQADGISCPRVPRWRALPWG
jgi:Tfp pilus assembly protein FimT